MSEQGTGRRVFTGTSRDGNLQEALDAAVKEAGQIPENANFFTWRLAAITGEQGGVVGADVVNVSIETGSATSDRDQQGGSGDSGELEVPTTRTGLVQQLPGTVDVCQDGAEFELLTQTADGEERLRLKPTNSEARDVLGRFLDTRMDVTVTGYIRRVECTRMDVYHADAARRD